jgi:hypothetical protein
MLKIITKVKGIVDKNNNLINLMFFYIFIIIIKVKSNKYIIKYLIY